MSETALTIRRTNTPMPVSSMSELASAGELIARSGLCGVKDAASGFIVALTCHQEGIPVLDFPKKYHIIQGRLSMRSDAMLAEFRIRGGRYKIVEASVNKAELLVTWEGTTSTFSYTMEDGRRTGDAMEGNKLKYNWEHRPESMLWARCVSRMVRMLCPEVVAGVYTPEEIMDIGPTGEVQKVAVVDRSVVERAMEKAKDVKVEVGPAKVGKEEGPVDYSICPDGFGDYSGKPWETLDSEVLASAAASDALSGEYREKIGWILEVRSSAKAEVVYAIGRPDPRHQGSFGMWWGPHPDQDKAFAQQADVGDVLFEMRRIDGRTLKSYVCVGQGQWIEQKEGAK